jgi:hypothetical protein
MQSKALLLTLVLTSGLAQPLAAADGRGGGGGRGGEAEGWRRHGGPNIVIEPYIDLNRRPKPNVDTPEFIMAELNRCMTAGVVLFVDCLRQNHSSVMIRRLEACVRSESIPDDPGRVLACLPPAGAP